MTHETRALGASCEQSGEVVIDHDDGDVLHTLRLGRWSRSAVVPASPETSMFAMSSIIFPSVERADHTLKPLQRKGKRPTPLRTMESSTRQAEVPMDPEAFEHAVCVYRQIEAEA